MLFNQMTCAELRSPLSLYSSKAPRGGFRGERRGRNWRPAVLGLPNRDLVYVEAILEAVEAKSQKIHCSQCPTAELYCHKRAGLLSKLP